MISINYDEYDECSDGGGEDLQYGANGRTNGASPRGKKRKQRMSGNTYSNTHGYGGRYDPNDKRYTSREEYNALKRGMTVAQYRIYRESLQDSMVVRAHERKPQTLPMGDIRVASAAGPLPPGMRYCVQCGRELPQTMFRLYQHSESRHRRCFTCERINNRAKALEKKSTIGTLAETEVAELQLIYNGYKKWSEAGRLVPNARLAAAGLLGGANGQGDVTRDVDMLMKALDLQPTKAVDISAIAYDQDGLVNVADGGAKMVPQELAAWLIRDLTAAPEIYNAQFDELYAKYRPAVELIRDEFGVGQHVYDDTYKVILGKIAGRLMDYEEEWRDCHAD